MNDSFDFNIEDLFSIIYFVYADLPLDGQKTCADFSREKDSASLKENVVKYFKTLSPDFQNEVLYNLGMFAFMYKGEPMSQKISPHKKQFYVIYTSVITSEWDKVRGELFDVSNLKKELLNYHDLILSLISEERKGCEAWSFKVKKNYHNFENKNYHLQPLVHNPNNTSCEPKLSIIQHLLQNKRGPVYIFNMIEFQGQAYRNGSKKDADSLDIIFTRLGYDVQICENFSADKVIKKLTNVSKQDHSTDEHFFIFFLSHGIDKHIYGIDEKCISIDDIVNIFKNSNCPNLGDKPRIIVDGTCQGNKCQLYPSVQPRQERNVTCSDNENRTIDLKESNFIIARGSISDYQCNRHETDGSWYIQTLCAEIENNWRNKDFEEILQDVNKSIEEKFSKTPTDKRQTPCYDVSSVKKIWLKY